MVLMLGEGGNSVVVLVEVLLGRLCCCVLYIVVDWVLCGIIK